MSLEKTLTKAMTIAPAAIVPMAGAAYAQDTSDEWGDVSTDTSDGPDSDTADTSDSTSDDLSTGGEDSSPANYSAGGMHNLGRLEGPAGGYLLGAVGTESFDSFSAQGLGSLTFAPSDEWRINLRANGGFGTETESDEDSTFNQGRFNTGLALGFYPVRGDEDVYLELGAFYDLFDLSQDVGDMTLIDLASSDVFQIGGRLGYASERFTIAGGFRLPVAGNYGGSIAGIPVGRDAEGFSEEFRPYFASLAGEYSFGDIALRLSGSYEAINFDDLLKIETGRVTAGIVLSPAVFGVDGLHINPYVSVRFQESDFPRTGQHISDTSWDVGAQVEHYFANQFVLIGDLGYDLTNRHVNIMAGLGITFGYSRKENSQD